MVYFFTVAFQNFHAIQGNPSSVIGLQMLVFIMGCSVPPPTTHTPLLVLCYRDYVLNQTPNHGHSGDSDLYCS